MWFVGFCDVNFFLFCFLLGGRLADGNGIKNCIAVLYSVTPKVTVFCFGVIIALKSVLRISLD